MRVKGTGARPVVTEVRPYVAHAATGPVPEGRRLVGQNANVLLAQRHHRLYAGGTVTGQPARAPGVRSDDTKPQGVAKA
jgi:hypothetical protein